VRVYGHERGGDPGGLSAAWRSFMTPRHVPLALLGALLATEGRAQEVLCAWPGSAQSANVQVIDSAGDVDFDGVADVIIGDPYFDVAPGILGNVVVRSGGDCSKELFQFVGSGWQDGFGSAAAGVGDVDGDGHSDFLIGYPGYSVTSPGAGACYLHSGKDGSLLWSAVGGPGLHGF